MKVIQQDSTVPREAIQLAEPGQPTLALQVQRVTAEATGHGDMIYVHGATFGADLSIFYRFDGRSWADEINQIGLSVWGFDFAGYGASDRYAQSDDGPPSGRLQDAAAQLRRVVAAVRAQSGDRPVALIGHSWGGSVAAHYAGICPQDVQALVLFAPIVRREPVAGPAPVLPPSSHYPVTLLGQYRRFIEDVPRGQPQVLDEAQFLAWGARYLASDATSARRAPPSVITPSGPLADIGALWSGQALYDPGRIMAPTLLVRGAWDALCTDADADQLLGVMASRHKLDAPIERGTHLLHLESQRPALYARVNLFLQGVMK
ncbi:MAG TPA: alpha/beta fold hydrolase [Rhodoferax sp.]|jgi:alpha-beta hydrolase superfamily lysophospholipase|nr:alpha/beta fold hydrolase [Rhodoferax sp.]